jgi:hypothetical protein
MRPWRLRGFVQEWTYRNGMPKSVNSISEGGCPQQGLKTLTLGDTL